MEEAPPFQAEYAKSSRASCKGCMCSISKDNLRLAEMVQVRYHCVSLVDKLNYVSSIQSPHFDGKVPNWYHPSCFFKKKTIRSTADVGGYDSLKWKDQETIQNKVMSSDGTSSGAKGKQIGKFGLGLFMFVNVNIRISNAFLSHRTTTDGISTIPRSPLI